MYAAGWSDEVAPPPDTDDDAGSSSTEMCFQTYGPRSPPLNGRHQKGSAAGLVSQLIHNDEGQQIGHVRILTSVHTIWATNRRHSHASSLSLRYAEEIKKADAGRVLATRPWDALVACCCLHAEMLFGPYYHPLNASLRSTYWFIHNTAGGTSRGGGRMAVSAPVDLGHQPSPERTLLGLYGECLTHRISVLAHDEAVLLPNWAVRTDIGPIGVFRSLVDVARRQLRVVDPLTKVLDYLITAMGTGVAGHTMPPSPQKGALQWHAVVLYALIRTEMQALGTSVAWLIARALAECCVDIELVTTDDFALWDTWVSFGKPLRLLHDRIATINGEAACFSRRC